MKVSVLPPHTPLCPVIGPGVAGALLIVTARILAAELPHVPLAVTDTVPPVEFVVAMILVVVDVPAHPDGSDHVYEVAPFTGDIEKVSRPLPQRVVRPLITPGVAGVVFTTTVKTCGAELPQLFAVTDTMPPVELVVAIILVVVEVPLHPDGSDHV